MQRCRRRPHAVVGPGHSVDPQRRRALRASTRSSDRCCQRHETTQPLIRSERATSPAKPRSEKQRSAAETTRLRVSIDSFASDLLPTTRELLNGRNGSRQCAGELAVEMPAARMQRNGTQPSLYLASDAVTASASALLPPSARVACACPGLSWLWIWSWSWSWQEYQPRIPPSISAAFPLVRVVHDCTGEYAAPRDLA
jgi:hypothetical protein